VKRAWLLPILSRALVDDITTQSDSLLKLWHNRPAGQWVEALAGGMVVWVPWYMEIPTRKKFNITPG
jgi:hypothetical protein